MKCLNKFFLLSFLSVNLIHSAEQTDDKIDCSDLGRYIDEKSEEIAETKPTILLDDIWYDFKYCPHRSNKKLNELLLAWQNCSKRVKHDGVGNSLRAKIKVTERHIECINRERAYNDSKPKLQAFLDKFKSK